jgi:hypothetical protein
MHRRRSAIVIACLFVAVFGLGGCTSAPPGSASGSASGVVWQKPPSGRPVLYYFGTPT